MQYLNRSFTLPSSKNTSQARWDLAFMTAEEFKNKYGVTDDEYEALKTKKEF